MAVGGTINTLIGAYFATQMDWSGVSSTALLSIGYIVCIGTGAAWQFNAFANQHLPPTITGLAICAQALMGVLLGAAVLGERISAQHVAGGLVIVASVVLIIYVRARELRETDELTAVSDADGDATAECATIDKVATPDQTPLPMCVQRSIKLPPMHAVARLERDDVYGAHPSPALELELGMDASGRVWAH